LQYKFDNLPTKSVAELMEEGKKMSVEQAMWNKFPIEKLDVEKRKKEVEYKENERQKSLEHQKILDVENIIKNEEETKKNHITEKKK